MLSKTELQATVAPSGDIKPLETSSSFLITLNPDYTQEVKIINGYIFYTNNKRVPELDLLYYNGMPLFSTNSEGMEFIGDIELLEYIHSRNPMISPVNPQSTVEFSYYYNANRKMYSFTELIITLPGVTLSYHRLGDNTLDEPPEDIDTFMLVTNVSGNFSYRDLTKEEMISETGFVMELHPRQQRLAIPKADSLIISKYLYEIALFIDHYPISHFFDILQV